MQKLYFLVPDQASAEAIVGDLRAAGLADSDIAVLAKNDQPLAALPEETEATKLEKSDLIPALQRGAALGGSMGLFAGLGALAFPPAGLVVGGGAVLASTAAGAAFGAWASSLIGVSAPNSQLEQFEQALERGEVLMLIDVGERSPEDLKTLVSKHHPEAEFAGVEPAVKVLPQDG